MRYYPINLDLEDRPCLVVGGGAVGTRKVKTLLDCAARVTVVSPQCSATLSALAGTRRLTLQRRGYRRSDLDGVHLVFAAASDPAVNRRVKSDAREAGVLCNLAQRPQDGDFILPSLVRQGDLVLSISTSGASPALAKHLRQRLETQFGPEYAMLLRLLKAVRRHLIDAGHDPDGHRRLLVRLVDGPLLEWLKSGDMTAVDELLERELGLSGGLDRLMALTPDD